MSETRSRKQIEANKLDCDIFRIMRRIDQFANDYRDDDARGMAATIDAMRHRIRKHMHRADQEATIS